jgi:regulator of RNase E activity RraB
MGIEDSHAGTALFALMYDIQNVAGVTAEAIQARYDQFVALAEKFDDGCQLCSTVATRA